MQVKREAAAQLSLVSQQLLLLIYNFFCVQVKREAAAQLWLVSQ